MDSNKIYLTDDQGKEIEMNILFTVDIENKSYVVVYEENDEDNLYPLSYDNEGNIYVVEDEEELSQLQEVVDAFESGDANEDND